MRFFKNHIYVVWKARIWGFLIVLGVHQNDIDKKKWSHKIEIPMQMIPISAEFRDSWVHFGTFIHPYLNDCNFTVWKRNMFWWYFLTASTLSENHESDDFQNILVGRLVQNNCSPNSHVTHKNRLGISNLALVNIILSKSDNFRFAWAHYFLISFCWRQKSPRNVQIRAFQTT